VSKLQEEQAAAQGRAQSHSLSRTPLGALPIYAFFSGCAISYVGDILTFLAIPWFVLQTTGSVTQTGIAAFFSTLPTVLSAFFGSVLVDRLGYKQTSVIGDILSGITVALIPLLYYTIGLAFWQLLALVFVGGLLKSPGVTARASMVPDLAKIAKMPLERANSFFDSISRISWLIGAPIAGVLISLIGTSNLLWFDAISFAISAFLIGVLVPTLAVSMKPQEVEQNYLATLWEGVRFIRNSPVLLSIVLAVMMTNLLDAALFSVIEPAYIKHIFNSAIPFGLLVAALGGSAFVGTLIFSAIGHRLPRRLTFGIGFTIGGALRFWILLLPILPILIAWHIIAGLAISPLNPLLSTLKQELTPVEMRARVFGTIGAGVMIGVPLGTFIAGYMAAWIGLQLSLLVMGALYLLTTLSLLVNPALKAMDKGVLTR
jgi:MFS family permease